MRQLVYYIACTVDGFIAGEDGSWDFFPMTGAHLAYIAEEYPETIPGHAREVMGATGPNRHFDAVVMGRHTYEPALKAGITSPYPQLRQYVVSSTMSESPDPAVTLVRDDPVSLVRRLKAEPGRDVWLCGGGTLASALADEIDALILKVNPVALGRGIPLFGDARAVPRPLELLEHRTFDGGVVVHRYRVRR
jgi:dihydrofolate reductase